MKNKNKILVITALAASVLITGCVTKDPATGQYVVSPQLATNSAAIRQAEPVLTGLVAVTPAAPVAPFVPSVTDAILGFIAIASAGLATWKNNQASKQTNAAAALAQTVVNAGQPTVAVAHTIAAQNGSSGDVAAHLVNAAKMV